MTTSEKTKVLRWLMLDAEDIYSAFNMKSYEVYIEKNRVGVEFEWEKENQSQHIKRYEYSEETNSHVNTAVNEEETLKSTM